MVWYSIKFVLLKDADQEDFKFYHSHFLSYTVPWTVAKGDIRSRVRCGEESIRIKFFRVRPIFRIAVKYICVTENLGLFALLKA